MKKRILSLLAAFIVIGAVVPVSAATSAIDERILAKGDVDNDGRITINDATTIQRWLAEYDLGVSECINSYEPIELNFIPYLENDEVSDGEDYAIIDSSELTMDILTHRAEENTLIVERVIGQVTDATTGDGRILNPLDPEYDYISYKRKCLSGLIADGTVIVTYLIYNPNNNYEDDIVNRFDFILDRKFEQ